MSRRFGIAAFCSVVALFTASALAETSELFVLLPKDLVFNVARDAVLARDWPIVLEDGTAGIIKFTYRDGTFEDAGAVLETVEQESGEVKMRITIPSDYIGRGKVLLSRIRKEADDIQAGRLGRKVERKPDWVYRAALRYVLKEFVKPPRGRDDVIKAADEKARFLRFVFRDGKFEEPNAIVRVIPLADRLCQVVVDVPSDPARRLLLEDRLFATLRDDSGDEKEDLH